MDVQDMDRALDAALKDLERFGCPRSSSDVTGLAPLFAAVMIIGRRLVPARSTADDVTMPGRRTPTRTATTGEAAAARALMSGRLDPLQGYTLGLRHDPPRPQVRDRIAGPAPMSDAERAIWQRDREELVDALTLRRDLCVTLGVSPQSSDAEVRAAAQTLAEDRRMLLAEHERLEGVEAGQAERIAFEVGRAESLRAGLRNALGLRSNALDSAIIAAVNEMAPVLSAANNAINEAREALTKALGIETELPTLAELLPRVTRRIAEVERRADDDEEALGTVIKDLEDRLAAAQQTIGEQATLLSTAQGLMDAARADLAKALCMSPQDTLAKLTGRAVQRIAALLEEHQRERTAVDELRADVAIRREHEIKLGEEVRAGHARWQRIQPLIKALHSWEVHAASDGPFDFNYEGDLLAAFAAWQKAEAAALDADDAPVDVPRQPDDPGVEPEPEAKPPKPRPRFTRVRMADACDHGVHPAADCPICRPPSEVS